MIDKKDWSQIVNPRRVPEVMYKYYAFSPEQKTSVNSQLPSVIREAHTSSKTTRGSVITQEVPISAFLEKDLTSEEIRNLEARYRIIVTPSTLQITPLLSNLVGGISFNLDWTSGEIKSFISGLSPSVISTLYDPLRYNSSFIREVFAMAQIPELTDTVKRSAEETQEKHRKRLSELSLIQPEITGICAGIKVKELDPAKTTEVGQKGYAFGHPSIPESQILYTYGLADCVAVAAYDGETKTGFLTHLDRPGIVVKAFHLIKNVLGDNARIIIYGGQGLTGQVASIETSRETLAAIFAQTKRLGFTIDGLDTRGTASRRIALDTQAGEVFIPG